MEIDVKNRLKTRFVSHISYIKINKHDLPLSCPLPSKTTLWNMHPRVFLAIEKTGEAICPYCNTKYIYVPAKK